MEIFPRRFITDKGLSRHLGDNSTIMKIYDGFGRQVNPFLEQGELVRSKKQFYFIAVCQNPADLSCKAFRFESGRTKVSFPLESKKNIFNLSYRSYTYV
jgi:hypothetical protein